MMKQFPHVMLTVFIGLIATFGLFARASETTELPRTIEVNGKAIVYIAPDVATLDVVYRYTDKYLQSSMNRSKALLDTLQEFGISKADIVTNYLSHYPQDDELYQRSATFSITIRDFSQLDQFMVALTQHHEVQFSNLSFMLSDPQSAVQQAQLQAVADAQQTGARVALAAGYELGNIISINVSNPSILSPQSAYKDFHNSEVVLTIGDSPIFPGDVTVREDVRVTFELKPKS
jgi:uncharacterized protein